MDNRGRPRQPIQLIQAAGKKHLTKEEIQTRMDQEVQPQGVDRIEPPAYLTAKQKREFNKISDQLIRLKVMGETDVDALARYVISLTEYERVTKALRKVNMENDLDSYYKLSLLMQKYMSM